MNDRKPTQAVPLLDGKRAHGSIALRWPRSSSATEAFAARNLTDLQAAAQEIVHSLRDGLRRRRKP